MLRPTLEYKSAVWEPYKLKDINRLVLAKFREEELAMYITATLYKDKNPGSVTNMIQQLGWETLQELCTHGHHRLLMIIMYKTINDMMSCVSQEQHH